VQIRVSCNFAGYSYVIKKNREILSEGYLFRLYMLSSLKKMEISLIRFQAQLLSCHYLTETRLRYIYFWADYCALSCHYATLSRNINKPISTSMSRRFRSRRSRETRGLLYVMTMAWNSKVGEDDERKEKKGDEISRKSTRMAEERGEGAINGVYPFAKLGLSYAYPSRVIINLTICMNARVQHGASCRKRALHDFLRNYKSRPREITRARDISGDKLGSNHGSLFVAFTFSYVYSPSSCFSQEKIRIVYKRAISCVSTFESSTKYKRIILDNHIILK